MNKKHSKVDYIVPIFNEESCIIEFIERIKNIRIKNTELEINIIFIDDGSTDNSLNIILNQTKHYKFIKCISLTRNFGHQNAVTAGLDYCNSDYGLVIDADLQDPPELLNEMIQKAQDGYDVVYGQRRKRMGETKFKLISAFLFYFLFEKLTKINIPKNTGDFRLVSKKAILGIRELREQHRFLRGLFPWLGFKSTAILYDRLPRYAGNTKYPLKKMLKFSSDAIYSFTDIPIRIAKFLGLITFILGLLGSIIMVWLRLYSNFNVPGITTIFLLIFIFGGFQIFILGIIGEYIYRIYDQSKKRPIYVVDNLYGL